MEITSDMVKTLRDETGISVMECKRALEEAGGDKEKALIILRKKGGALALKKADRTLLGGTVSAYIHATKEVGSMVLIRSETDFVSKNEAFAALAKEIALQVAAASPLYVKREDIPKADLKKIEESFEKEVAGKPDNLKKTIRAGKVDAYLKNLVLFFR